MINDGVGTEVYAQVDGNVITIVKGFTLNKSLPISLIKGLTLNIGSRAAANNTSNLSKEVGAGDSQITVVIAPTITFNAGDGDIVLYENGNLQVGLNGAFNMDAGTSTLYGKLNIADGGMFNTGNGYVDLAENGNMSIGNGGAFNVEEGAITLRGKMSIGTNSIFNIGNGRTNLYGILDVGKGRIKSDVSSDSGLMVIHPNATLKDITPENTERELVGKDSIILSAGAKLELKGEFVLSGSKSRILTLDGGSATVISDMAIFNNGSNENEKIVLKNVSTIIIGNNGTLGINNTTDSNPDVGSISNYITVNDSSSGTISCVPGGSLIINNTSVLWGGSMAAWSGNTWILLQE
jgi:hypothetical protein